MALALHVVHLKTEIVLAHAMKAMCLANVVVSAMRGTPPCGGVSHEQSEAPHEVVGESPRRIILDIANISEHEKAAGTNFANLKLHLSICVRRKDVPLVFEISLI